MNAIPSPRMGSRLASAAKLLATLASLTAATLTHAQSNADILNLLVEKGVITKAEAESLVAEARQKNEPPNAAQPAPKPTAVIPTAKAGALEKLAFSTRLQAQYAAIGTDIDNAGDPADTNHLFIRRAYFGIKGQLVDNATAVITYDFASSNFDAAYIDWELNDRNSLNVGLTKVPFGFEEFQTSSGSLKAIERSAVTRFFVEPNNGRRLGAGVYRNGVFLKGKNGNWDYQIALTNPERISSPTSAGNDSNNGIAPWAYAGYKQAIGDGYLRSGVSFGYLPDQGGTVLGAGDDLLVGSLFFDYSQNNFRVSSEIMSSDNEQGAAPGQDSNSWGYFIQPSYRFSEKWEGVFRYSYVDSDGRGINLSDAVRSAPSGGTMDTLKEAYFGGNYFFHGDNLKLQFGLVYGKSQDALDGTEAKAESFGARTMLQLQY